MTTFGQSTSTESTLRRENFKLRKEIDKLKKRLDKSVIKYHKARAPRVADLKKRAWKVFSEWVRRTEKGVCFTCGKVDRWQATHAGHFIDASVCGYALNLNPYNVHCQCVRCNYWKSGNKSEYRRKMVEVYGQDLVDGLENQRGTDKPSREFFDGVIKQYEGLLDDMETVKSLPQETTYGGKI